MAMILRRDFLRSSSLLGRVALVSAIPFLGALTACQDKDKELEKLLAPALADLLPLTERDSKQVRDGVPAAAEVIVKHIDTDPGADAEGLKRALTKAREEVKDLAFSKITFFAFVGTDGNVLRSEAETDLAVGNSLTKAIADTKKLLEKDSGVLETFGYMEGLRGVNKGNELQWLVGAPVKHKDGQLVGAVIAGWSLRLYAKYLDAHFKQALEKQKEDPSKPNPLAYVFVVKGKMAYGGPDAPDVNATVLGELDLPSKVNGDELFQTSLEIETRKFLIGARKAPALGDDLYVVAMLSAV
jgi:hypothetical protein